MITLQGILSKLREMKPLLENKYKIINLEIFGSYVKGTENLDSDIDILVEFKENADLFDLIKLSQFLEEKLNKKIDLVSKQSLRKELKQKVFKEVVAVWEIINFM